MIARRVLAAVVAALGWAFVTAPARAETQLLYLAEDVPAGLDFDGPSASTNTSQVGFLNMLEPLVDYPKGKDNDEGIGTLDFSRYEGRLAESWEYDAATLTWTLHLRHGVKSCAGNTFTADDVLWSFSRAKSISGATPVGWFLASVGSIEGFNRDVFKPGSDKTLGTAITKVDDYTVKIKQSTANPLFLEVLTVYGTYPFDSQELKKHLTPDDPWGHTYVNTVSVPGFGAYCLERWTKDDEFVMRANQNYYRGKPAIDRVFIKRVPQSANRALTLRSGQAQLTQRLTAREFEGLRTAKGVKVAGIYGNEVLFLGLNFKTRPFDNLKLREAIAMAIPYRQLAAIGYANQARKWESQFASSLNLYAKPAAQYQQDAARAKQLLAEAGYPDGKGLEAFPEAFKLSFVAERESYLGPIATSIQSALKDIGIPVQLDPLPQTQLADRRMVKKDLPMALSDTEKPVGPDVIYATKLFFVSPSAGGVNNMVNYSSADVDRLFGDALAETDGGKRAALAKEIQEIIQRDLAWVPLLETKSQWAFSAKLSGITWHPDNSIRLFDLRLEP